MHRLIIIATLAGCTSTESQHWVAGFDPPAAMAGYTRYVTPTVTGIAPGADIEYCQWVEAPSSIDRDVLDLVGLQSPSGHHAVLYASDETNFKVGESHECTTDDMLSISFVGAIGGEGTAGAGTRLPDGLYFRLPAGKALMVNTHWLNATDNTLDGQAVLDLKFGPASIDHTTADVFVNNGDTFAVDPGKSGSYDTTCVVQQDLSLAMIANHMHALGSSIYSELVHGDGTKQMLVTDMPWSGEEAFNPRYIRYTVDQPLLVRRGETIHTHCEWNNTSSNVASFPDEMCLAVSFYFPSHGQIVCENGGWPQ